MFNRIDITSAGANLERLVRIALTFGELSPGVEAEISRVLDDSALSNQDVRLMAILQDAIANGDVKRIKLPTPPLQTSAIQS